MINQQIAVDARNRPRYYIKSGQQKPRDSISPKKPTFIPRTAAKNSNSDLQQIKKPLFQQRPGSISYPQGQPKVSALGNLKPHDLQLSRMTSQDAQGEQNKLFLLSPGGVHVELLPERPATSYLSQVPYQNRSKESPFKTFSPPIPVQPPAQGQRAQSSLATQQREEMKQQPFKPIPPNELSKKEQTQPMIQKDLKNDRTPVPHQTMLRVSNTTGKSQEKPKGRIVKPQTRSSQPISAKKQPFKFIQQKPTRIMNHETDENQIGSPQVFSMSEEKVEFNPLFAHNQQEAQKRQRARIMEEQKRQKYNLEATKAILKQERQEMNNVYRSLIKQSARKQRISNQVHRQAIGSKDPTLLNSPNKKDAQMVESPHLEIQLKKSDTQWEECEALHETEEGLVQQTNQNKETGPIFNNGVPHPTLNTAHFKPNLGTGDRSKNTHDSGSNWLHQSGDPDQVPSHPAQHPTQNSSGQPINVSSDFRGKKTISEKLNHSYGKPSSEIYESGLNDLQKCLTHNQAADAQPEVLDFLPVQPSSDLNCQPEYKNQSEMEKRKSQSMLDEKKMPNRFKSRAFSQVEKNYETPNFQASNRNKISSGEPAKTRKRGGSKKVKKSNAPQRQVKSPQPMSDKDFNTIDVTGLNGAGGHPTGPVPFGSNSGHNMSHFHNISNIQINNMSSASCNQSQLIEEQIAQPCLPSATDVTNKQPLIDPVVAVASEVIMNPAGSNLQYQVSQNDQTEQTEKRDFEVHVGALSDQYRLVTLDRITEQGEAMMPANRKQKIHEKLFQEHRLKPIKRQKLFDKYYTKTGKAKNSKKIIDLSYPDFEMKQMCLKSDKFFASKGRAPHFVFNEKFKSVSPKAKLDTKSLSQDRFATGTFSDRPTWRGMNNPTGANQSSKMLKSLSPESFRMGLLDPSSMYSPKALSSSHQISQRKLKQFLTRVDNLNEYKSNNLKKREDQLLVKSMKEVEDLEQLRMQSKVGFSQFNFKLSNSQLDQINKRMTFYSKYYSQRAMNLKCQKLLKEEEELLPMFKPKIIRNYQTIKEKPVFQVDYNKRHFDSKKQGKKRSTEFNQFLKSKYKDYLNPKRTLPVLEDDSNDFRSLKRQNHSPQNLGKYLTISPKSINDCSGGRAHTGFSDRQMVYQPLFVPGKPNSDTDIQQRNLSSEQRPEDVEHAAEPLMPSGNHGEIFSKQSVLNFAKENNLEYINLAQSHLKKQEPSPEKQAYLNMLHRQQQTFLPPYQPDFLKHGVPILNFENIPNPAPSQEVQTRSTLQKVGIPHPIGATNQTSHQSLRPRADIGTPPIQLQTHSKQTSSGLIESASEPCADRVMGIADPSQRDQGYITPNQIPEPDVQPEKKPPSNRWKRKPPQTFKPFDEDKLMEQDLPDEFPDEAYIEKHIPHYSHASSVPDELPDDPAELEENRTVQAMNNTMVPDVSSIQYADRGQSASNFSMINPAHHQGSSLQHPADEPAFSMATPAMNLSQNTQMEVRPPNFVAAGRQIDLSKPHQPVAEVSAPPSNIASDPFFQIVNIPASVQAMNQPPPAQQLPQVALSNSTVLMGAAQSFSPEQFRPYPPQQFGINEQFQQQYPFQPSQATVPQQQVPQQFYPQMSAYQSQIDPSLMNHTINPYGRNNQNVGHVPYDMISSPAVSHQMTSLYQGAPNHQLSQLPSHAQSLQQPPYYDPSAIGSQMPYGQPAETRTAFDLHSLQEIKTIQDASTVQADQVPQLHQHQDEPEEDSQAEGSVRMNPLVIKSNPKRNISLGEDIQ